MVLLYFLLGFYFLLSLSLYKVFEKIGFEGWKALVPGLNFVLWCQAIGRPKWWAALLLLPIVNIFILTGMCVAMVRSFKQYKFRDSVKAVLLAPIAFLQIGFDQKLQYDGPSITKERDYLSQLAAARKQGQQQKLKKLQAKNPLLQNSPPRMDGSRGFCRLRSSIHSDVYDRSFRDSDFFYGRYFANRRSYFCE